MNVGSGGVIVNHNATVSLLFDSKRILRQRWPPPRHANALESSPLHGDHRLRGYRIHAQPRAECDAVAARSGHYDNKATPLTQCAMP
jgi:hypothetical protein